MCSPDFPCQACSCTTKVPPTRKIGTKAQRLTNQRPKHAAVQAHASCEATLPDVFGTTIVVSCKAYYLKCNLGKGSIVRDPSHLLPADTVCSSISVRCAIFTVYPKIKPTRSLEHTRGPSCKTHSSPAEQAQELRGTAARRPGKYNDSLVFSSGDVGLAVNNLWHLRSHSLSALQLSLLSAVY